MTSHIVKSVVNYPAACEDKYTWLATACQGLLNFDLLSCNLPQLQRQGIQSCMQGLNASGSCRASGVAPGWTEFIKGSLYGLDVPLPLLADLWQCFPSPVPTLTPTATPSLVPPLPISVANVNRTLESLVVNTTQANVSTALPASAIWSLASPSGALGTLFVGGIAAVLCKCCRYGTKTLIIYILKKIVKKGCRYGLKQILKEERHLKNEIAIALRHRGIHILGHSGTVTETQHIQSFKEYLRSKLPELQRLGHLKAEHDSLGIFKGILQELLAESSSEINHDEMKNYLLYHLRSHRLCPPLAAEIVRNLQELAALKNRLDSLCDEHAHLTGQEPPSGVFSRTLTGLRSRYNSLFAYIHVNSTNIEKLTQEMQKKEEQLKFTYTLFQQLVAHSREVQNKGAQLHTALLDAKEKLEQIITRYGRDGRASQVLQQFYEAYSEVLADLNHHPGVLPPVDPEAGSGVAGEAGAASVAISRMEADCRQVLANFVRQHLSLVGHNLSSAKLEGLEFLADLVAKKLLPARVLEPVSEAEAVRLLGGDPEPALPAFGGTPALQADPSVAPVIAPPPQLPEVGMELSALTFREDELSTPSPTPVKKLPAAEDSF